MAKDTVNKIIDLGASNDLELRCAAIKVLGSLGIKNKRISKLFLDNIAHEHHVVKRFAFEALAENPSRDAAPTILKIIDDGAVEYSKARTMLMNMGTGIIPLLKKRYPDVHDQTKKLYIDIIAKNKSAEARNFLFNCILNSSLDLLKYICHAMRDSLTKLTAKEKTACVNAIKSYVQKAEKERNFYAVTSFIILLGFLQTAACKAIFIYYIKKNEREYFHARRNALIALSRMPLSGSQDALVKSVFPLLAHHDHTIVKACIDILSKVPLSSQYDKKIKELLQSRHQEVRCFAIESFSRRKTKSAADELITYLSDKDQHIREAAERALKNMPSALSSLIALIPITDDQNVIRATGYILKEQKSKLTAERCTKLYSAFEKLVLKDDAKYGNYYTVFRIAMPEYLYKTALKKAQNFKSRKKFKDAQKMLQFLNKGLLYTDDVKYETAVVFLKLSAQNTSKLFRDDDMALRLFEQLVKVSDIALLKRLKKEVCLGAEDFFYVGFHFSEKLFELRDFGIALLRHLIKKYPRSKSAGKAKKKLAQAGS